MTAKTFVQPDFTTQTATAYKTSIDDDTSVHNRIAGAFAPHQQTVADMTARIDAGVIPALAAIHTEVAAQNTGTITAPSANPRKDIIYIDQTSGTIGVATGAEAASPVDPAVPAGKVAVARINLVVSQTEIINADIDDLRALTFAGLAASLIWATHIKAQTQGMVPYFGASGAPSLLSAGTSGQFLKTLGAGANPEWDDVTAGGLVLLSRVNASAAATIEFNSADGIDNTLYDGYVIRLDTVWPSTAGQALWMRLSDDDGVVWDSGATQYKHATHSVDEDQLEEKSGSSGDAKIVLTRGTEAINNVNYTFNGDIRSPNLRTGVGRTAHTWTIGYSEVTSVDLTIQQGVGMQNDGDSMNAIQLLMASGNINGVVSLYGISNS